MISTRVSEYRSHLSGFHRQVLQNREPLLVAGSNQGDVVVIAAEDYELLQETIAILKDRATLNSLLQTRLMVQEGTYEGFDVEDIDGGAED